MSDSKQGPAGADEGRSGSGFRPLEGQRRIDYGILAAIIAAVLLLIFILQNTRQTKVTWFVLDKQGPLWVVIAVTAVVSALLSQLLSFAWRRRRRREH